MTYCKSQIVFSNTFCFLTLFPLPSTELPSSYQGWAMQLLALGPVEVLTPEVTWVLSTDPWWNHPSWRTGPSLSTFHYVAAWVRAVKKRDVDISWAFQEGRKLQATLQFLLKAKLYSILYWEWHEMNFSLVSNHLLWAHLQEASEWIFSRHTWYGGYCSINPGMFFFS